MSSEWKTTRLGDLIDVKHGFAFKSEYFTERQTRHQLVTPGNFAIGGGFQLGKGKFYSGPVPDDYVLKKGQVVVTMTDLSRGADTLGYSAVIPETEATVWLHNQRVGLVQVKPHAGVCSEFLHYLMRCGDYRHHVVASATGSTVKHTAPSRICDFKFQLPSLGEQKEIATTLGALDDRITLLRETNATLEAIAQALFKSWFVDFDPIRAKQEGRAPEGMDEATASLFPDGFEESELGLVPRGWRVGLLGDELKISYGKNLPTTKLLPAGYPVYGGNGRIGFIDKYLYETRQVLIACRGAASGKVNQSSPKAFVTNNSLILESDISTFLPFGYLKGYMLGSDLTPFVTGSAQPQVTIDNLKVFKILIPCVGALKAFESFSSVIEGKIEENEEQAKTLATLRDTLLPRLISGQLRLSEVCNEN